MFGIMQSASRQWCFPAAHPELSSIFTYYAKSGSGGKSVGATFTLQQNEISNFALDCDITSSKFVRYTLALRTLIW